jgi:hypothetical protein
MLGLRNVVGIPIAGDKLRIVRIQSAYADQYASECFQPLAFVEETNAGNQGYLGFLRKDALFETYNPEVLIVGSALVSKPHQGLDLISSAFTALLTRDFAGEQGGFVNDH